MTTAITMLMMALVPHVTLDTQSAMESVSQSTLFVKLSTLMELVLHAILRIFFLKETVSLFQSWPTYSYIMLSVVQKN